ncbi:ferredoxin [Candidatus Pacearchaeota archaeon]|jgi:ferredoxin|nr:ferredoxin [Candidatus Pacearchaeota archaeon]|tara:strand:- start:12170 stop:12343 length:174 start_codon:yes stop_codon:yes gene_type:complete
MTIKINKEKCIGCGLCSSVCEEVFEMKDDMKAHVKSQKNIPCTKEAITSCPTEAISK